MTDSVRPSSPNWLNRTVVGAGITSGLGDVTHESASVILPGFLAVMGMPAATLGAIEGVADALSSFTKLGAGYAADRVGQRKTLVAVGYALTAVMLVFFALATSWVTVLIGRVVGWLGRGIRGPLRDAIMAQAITPETRGRAFGFHRAADSLGAVIGPLLGVALLAWAGNLHLNDPAGAFRIVFWLMLIPGVASVLSFAILVIDNGGTPNPALRFWATLRSLPADFRRYLAAVGLFGMGDFAPTLLILGATHLLTPRFGVVHAAQLAGLLYVGRNVVETLASFPIGVLADRFGHQRVLVVGYVLGVATAALMAYAFALQLDSLYVLTAVFALAGLYIAIEESLESSMTASYVAEDIRGTSYGALGSVNGVGDLVSSVAVGFLWTAATPAVGFGFAAVLMALGAAAMALLQKKA